MKKISTILFLVILSAIILFSAWPMIQGNVDFHTDIARDFLLLEDVYYNHNITLIGPRSGGIPGVFHGPLWLYLNLPAYIIGGGNPVVVGWFWLMIFILSIGVVYYVGKKMFDKTTAVFGSLLFASSTGASVYAFFNPAGAVLLAPLFMYLLWLYIQKLNPYVLAATVFVLGCIIQFQMAFGVPLLVVVTPILLYQIVRHVKTKKTFHFIVLLSIAVPLASYFLFELRHDFLQIRSVINYLSGVENAGKVDISFYDLLISRINTLINDTPGMVGSNVLWITFLIVFSLMSGIVQGIKKITIKNPYVLFVVLYLGYWVVTLPYKGAFWGYYYWPFVSMLSVIVASSHTYIGKKFFIVIMTIILLSNINLLFRKNVHDHEGTGGGWKFFHSVAKDVLADAPSEFGYYVFTTDLYGYSSQYAIHYEDRKAKNKTGFSYQKKPTTYLLVDDPGDHHAVNSVDWKRYDVRIAKETDDVTQVAPTFFIQKYFLTPEEAAEPSNPNMLNSLIFR